MRLKLRKHYRRFTTNDGDTSITVSMVIEPLDNEISVIVADIPKTGTHYQAAPGTREYIEPTRADRKAVADVMRALRHHVPRVKAAMGLEWRGWRSSDR